LPNLTLLATCCVRLEPGPLPSTSVTRLRRYYGPIRHPMTPGPSVAGVRFGRPRPRHRASRVACAFLVYMLPPLPRRGDGRSHCAHPFRRVSLPRNGSRVGPRIDLFEACSAFTRVAACTLALPPNRGSLTRRLQPCRFLYSCSGASGWSGCRVGLSPTGKRRLCTAHANTSRSRIPIALPRSQRSWNPDSERESGKVALCSSVSITSIGGVEFHEPLTNRERAATFAPSDRLRSGRNFWAGYQPVNCPRMFWWRQGIQISDGAKGISSRS